MEPKLSRQFRSALQHPDEWRCFGARLLTEGWRLATVDLGSWLIAHGPKAPQPATCMDAIDLASDESFPASDPPSWIGSARYQSGP